VPASVDDYFYQIERIPEWQIILAIVIVLNAVLPLALLAIFLASIGRIGMIRGTQHILKFNLREEATRVRASIKLIPIPYSLYGNQVK